jgi:hypothetical protein
LTPSSSLLPRRLPSLLGACCGHPALRLRWAAPAAPGPLRLPAAHAHAREAAGDGRPAACRWRWRQGPQRARPPCARAAVRSPQADARASARPQARLPPEVNRCLYIRCVRANAPGLSPCAAWLEPRGRAATVCTATCRSTSRRRRCTTSSASTAPSVKYGCACPYVRRALCCVAYSTSESQPQLPCQPAALASSLRSSAR